MENKNMIKKDSSSQNGNVVPRFIPGIRTDKLSCKSVTRLLSAFVDGELPPKLMTKIEEHLKGCASCMQEKESILASLNLLDESMPAIEPSPYFWSKLKQQVLHQEEKKKLTIGIFGWLTYKPATAAALAALVIGLLLGNFLGKALYYPEEITKETAYAEALNLGVLDDFPPGSIGKAYVELITQGR